MALSQALDKEKKLSPRQHLNPRPSRYYLVALPTSGTKELISFKPAVVDE